MNQQDLEQFKEVVRDVVSQSHLGVSNAVSNNINDLKLDMREVKTTLLNLLEQKKIQNGKVSKHSEDIRSLLTWRGVITGGIAVILATTMPLVWLAFNNLNEKIDSIKQEMK